MSRDKYAPVVPSDEALMERFVLWDDSGAGDKLIERYIDPALGVALRYCPQRSLAEDAVQEAFVRLVKKKQSYQQGKAFAPWFFTIVRRCCIDQLRQYKRRRSISISEMQIESITEPVDIPAEDNGALQILVDRLSVADSNVLILRVVHELEFDALAAALGCSESAARKRYTRARKRAQAILLDSPVPKQNEGA